ncbi:MFS transporter [Alteraurantiacibacter palmitatis]|uniref:MFS transporter n=1 Tax=Alteraurantiacibacter palmitatis TaxID=2054628 RepID=A0ABV7E6K9_9SPHN
MSGGLTRGIIFLLGTIAALGSLATQMLVPALPTLSAELGVGVASAQLVIGVFLIGLGGGQLLIGPLADRVERRTLLLAGLALYAAASLLAACAETLAVLLAARLLQAVGASAGLVTARVLLNALAPPDKKVSAQAGLMGIVLISPALAPVLGGALTEWLGWRAVLWGLCLAGLIAVPVVLRHIPAHVADGVEGPRAGLRASYSRILRNRRFLAASAAMAFASASLYLFLGTVPFLLERGYALSPRDIGLCLLLVAGASIAGTRLVGATQRRTDTLLLGTGLGVLAAAGLALLAASGPPALPLLIGPLMLLGLTAGFIGPTAIARIMAAEKGLEGTATSLAGALQMGVSALCAWALGPFGAQGPWQLALVLLPLTLAALLAAGVSRWRESVV